MGDRIGVSDIKDGSLICIQTQYISPADIFDWSGWYLSDNPRCTKTVSPNTVWQVSAAPVGEDGVQRYYLMNYATGQFVGDLYGNLTYKMVGIDSARTFALEEYNGTSSVYNYDNKSVVFRCEVPTAPEMWRVQYLDICPDELTNVIASYDTKASNANGVPLSVFAVKEEQDYAADLQTQVDVIANCGEMYPAGINPGEYDQGAVSAFETAMNKAMSLLIGAKSEDQVYIDAKNELIQAWDEVRKAVIPISEGYYFLVSANSVLVNSETGEKALTTNDAYALWATLDTSNPEFVWQLTPSGDNYYVLNLGTNRYLSLPDTVWFSSAKRVSVSLEPLYVQEFDLQGNAQWQIKPQWVNGGFGNYPYRYTTVNADVSAKQGYIGTGIPSGLDNADDWYLRKITDPAILDNLSEIIAANNRVKTMGGLVEEANNLVDKILVYKLSGDGLITTAGNNVNGNQITFTSVRTQGIEGADDYKFLIDGLDSTYMQGAGSINVDISKTPAKNVAITYGTRAATSAYPNAGQWGMDERPAQVVLYASKSNGDDSLWVKIDSTDMSSLGVSARWFVDMGDSYSYLRLKVVASANGRDYFTLSEFQIYNYEEDKENSQYFTVTGMKEAVDALQTQIDTARKAVEQKRVSEQLLADMQQALANVRALYSDTTSLKELIAQAQVLLTTANVGDQLGDLNNGDVITALQAAITNAQDPALYSLPLNKTGIETATKSLNDGMSAFKAAIRMPDPDKWYYIRSATSLNVRSEESGHTDARCYGSVLYTKGNNSTAQLSWGYVDNNGDMTNIYSPSTMWRFVPTEIDGVYSIQNLGSGFYIGGFKTQNIAIQQSVEPAPYAVNLLGDRQFAIVSQTATNAQNLALYCGGTSTNILTTSPARNENGAWTLTAVEPEEIEGISISEFANNLIDVMTLPYDIKDISNYNSDVSTYGIKKITQDVLPSGELLSTIELYEKTAVKAGEPCIIICGDTAQNVPCEDFDLFFPFPTTVTNKPIAANGLTGVVAEAVCPKGTGISTAKKFVPLGTDYTVAPHTGVIDPAKYQGEVVGVETKVILTAIGLNPISAGVNADVNSDGVVNSADIAVIYAYIANSEQAGYDAEQVDVNCDGVINSSDIAAVYSQIGGAASRGIPVKSLRLQKQK